jgi:predicted AAA+ superfamily ATPase
MNIQDAAHLSIHPMRGALFENFVMLELLKQRLNAGLSADLYFWRDNLGDEIDIVIEHGDVAVPVEVKSSATVTADHFRTLRKWRAITKQDQRAFLVYAGSEAHDVNDTYVIPWDSLLDIRKRLKR